MKLSTIAILFISFCFLGCAYLFFPTTVENISSEKPFCEYLGKKMTIKRSMNLWQWGNYYSLNEIEDKADDIDLPNTPKINNLLPIGTFIVLNDFYYTKNYDFPFKVKTVVSANGKIIIPHTNEELEFKYIWGKNGNLFRAPWEDNKIPKKRRIKR